MVVGLEAIPALISFAESFAETIAKLQLISDSKASITRDLEAFLKDSLRKKVKKLQKPPEERLVIDIATEDNKKPPVDEDNKTGHEGIESELALMREESKITIGVRSDSSESSGHHECILFF